MTLGLFARTFPRPAVEQVFDAVAAHGVSSLQFNFACAGLPSLPESLEPGLLERIRRAASERGLSLAAVSGTFNMIHPDPAQRQDGLRRLEVVAGACAALGTQVVTLCTGTRAREDMWRHHPDNDTPEAWRDLLHSLTSALQIAERHHVFLGIEPEITNVVSSATHARRLLDELRAPRLKIVLDAANLFQPATLPRMKDVLEEAFELLGEHLALVHGKELAATGHASQQPLGSGVLDWTHYLTLLRRAEFRGSLILHGFEEKDAAQSVSFVRGALTRAGY
jgi:sugar phosphate isomerase/epimerase